MARKARKKNYDLTKDKHLMNNIQIGLTIFTSSLYGWYLWENIKRVNPQIANEWDYKKKNLKKKTMATINNFLRRNSDIED